MIYRIFVFLNNLIATPVHGQSLRDKFGDVQNTGAEGNPSFESFVESIYNFAFPLAITVSLLLLAFGAYKLITSAGDQERLREAREIITNAIMGVIMIGIGLAVLAVIAGKLNIPL